MRADRANRFARVHPKCPRFSSARFVAMKASLAVLCWLTLILGASNDEEVEHNLSTRSCLHFTKIVPSQVYYIHNPWYPFRNIGQGWCLWSLESAYRIQMKCTLDTPVSPNCTEDSLAIQYGSNVVHKYCGKRRFSLVTDEPSTIIQFRWPLSSRGAKFFCSATAFQYQPFNTYDCFPTWDVDCLDPAAIPTRPTLKIETTPNEFLMMCGLVSFLEKMLYCGCTIIHNKYVLTAAHCLHNRNVSTIGVLVGDYDYTTDNDTDASMLYGVEKGITHPDYDMFKKINDIAVIRVKEWIQFNTRVGPAYLPFQHSSDTFTGFGVTVLGWGMMDFGGELSTVLRKVMLDVQTKQQCKKTYLTVNDDQICTYRKNKDSCAMDSGGPVLWKNPTSGNMVLVGVINYGINCAARGSVNARVGAYIDWITSVTPDADYDTIE